MNQPQPHDRVTALLEYSPRLKKAFVRAVLPYGQTLPPLEPENTQNHIGTFFGLDHGFHVGISPLIEKPILEQERESVGVREEGTPQQAPVTSGLMSPPVPTPKPKHEMKKQYYGTKHILAIPLTLGAYNQRRGWDIPQDEDANREGYMVEYDPHPSSPPNLEGHEGYVSWSPKEVFEDSYRENGSLTFGDAIAALKSGKRVQRAGWNGKNMFLFLLPASDGIPTKVISDPALRQVIETEIGGDSFDALGSIRMFTADRKILTGWLASQSDILAEDWSVLV